MKPLHVTIRTHELRWPPCATARRTRGTGPTAVKAPAQGSRGVPRPPAERGRRGSFTSPAPQFAEWTAMATPAAVRRMDRGAPAERPTRIRRTAPGTRLPRTLGPRAARPYTTVSAALARTPHLSGLTQCRGLCESGTAGAASQPALWLAPKPTVAGFVAGAHAHARDPPLPRPVRGGHGQPLL